MTQGKFQMDDASHLNGEWKISNWWCQSFKKLSKNFERTLPAVAMANEQFQTADARHLNCLNETIWNTIPGVQTAKEKGS